MQNDDNLHVAPLRTDEVSRILAWRYEGPYSVYDTSLADVPRLRLEMLQGRSEFLAVRESSGLLGFCSFGTDGRVPGGTYDESATDLGAGMDPTQVGCGSGKRFLQAIVDHAFHQLGYPALRATIASWNQRALRAADAVGFAPKCTFLGPSHAEFTVLLLCKPKPLT